MKTFTICFIATGGIIVDAETEDEALDYFYSERGQRDAAESLLENDMDITEIYEEDNP